MRSLLYIIVIILFNAFSVRAIELFPKRYGDKRWNAHLTLGGQYSLYQNKLLGIPGVRVGVVYNGVHKLGFGYNENLVPGKFTDSLCCGQETLGDYHRPKIRMFSVVYEATIFKSKRWEWLLPVFYDFGEVGVKYFNQDASFIEEQYFNASAIRLEIQNRYFLGPWLATKWSVGGRLPLKGNDYVKTVLKPMYLNISISINLIEVYRAYEGTNPWFYKKGEK